MTLSTARDLAGNFPDERIREKLASFDWLRGEKDGRVLRSPAGFLVQSIREDYDPPEGFRLQAEKARATAAQRRRARELEEERERREAAEEERERLRLERVRAFWDSLAGPEREKLWAKAVDAANPFYLRHYRDHEGKGNENERRWKELLLYPILVIELDGNEAIA